jgi:hypothetical protein
VLLALGGAGCAGEAPSASEAFRSLALAVEALDNRVVQLEEGRADFPEEGIEVILDELLLTGTLDGVEGEATTGFLYTNREGDLSQMELALGTRDLSSGPGEMRHLDSFSLGGPFRAEGIRYQGGEILVYLLDFAPDDPPCCPTISVQRRFQVVDGALREVEIVDPIGTPGETPA